jgi:putative phosphoesterase
LTSSPERRRSDERPTFAAPLTIGVLADTHVYRHGQRRLPPEVNALFARLGVNLILHAGDVNTRSVVDELARIAPTLAVCGNNDDAELQATLPEVIELDAGRFVLVLLHGHQDRTARLAARRYAGRADCVVYGHSHIPKIEEVDGTILFNPGSPTDRRWRPHFGVGLLRVTAEAISPELILFADPGHLGSVT